MKVFFLRFLLALDARFGSLSRVMNTRNIFFQILLFSAYYIDLRSNPDSLHMPKICNSFAIRTRSCY